MRQFLVFIVVCFFSLSFAFSQSPFDLKRGQKRIVIENKTINPNSNPFDLVRFKALSEDYNPQKVKADIMNLGKAFPVPSSGNRLITLFLLLIFSTLILGYSTKLIGNSFKMLSNTNMFLRHIKSQKSLVPQGEQLLILVLFVINCVVLLIFSDILKSNSFLPLSFGSRFGVLILFLITLFVVKFITNKVLSFVFDTSEVFRVYSQAFFNVISILTLFFIPLNLMLIYAPESVSIFSQYFMVSLLSVGMLFFIYRNVILSSNHLSKRFFHFILYLCAFEIVPIALLAKILLK